MKNEDAKLWLEYIKLNADLMRIHTENLIKDEKIDKIYTNCYFWHINRINMTVERILKELAEQ